MNESTVFQARRFWILLAAIAVALSAVTWIGVANAQGSSSNVESGTAIIRSLTADHSTAELLPGFVAESGMDSQIAESARYLVSSDTASYWAALDEKGSVCLVTVPNYGPEFAAVTCSAQDDFLSHGVVIAVNSETGTSWGAYLIPAGSFLLENQRGLVALSASVIEVDPLLLQGSPSILLADGNGAEGLVMLRPFPASATP